MRPLLIEFPQPLAVEPDVRSPLRLGLQFRVFNNRFETAPLRAEETQQRPPCSDRHRRPAVRQMRERHMHVVAHPGGPIVGSLRKLSRYRR